MYMNKKRYLQIAAAVAGTDTVQ